MQIRAEFKKRVPRQFWPFFRKIDKHIIYLTYLILSIRRYYQRKRLNLNQPYPQSVPVFVSKIQFSTDSGKDLESLLSAAGLTCHSGRHSVYIGREPDLSRINDSIIENYPGNVGLKIIKSRQSASDNSPYYTSSELAPASTYWSMTAIGSMAEKKAVSNLLYSQGVAPRVYDLIKLQSENGAYHYAFVVEHINGDILYGPEGEQFIVRFKEALSLYGMDTISIEEHSDLRPPEFRNNIISGAEGARYVDIQNFVLSDPAATKAIERNFLQRSGQIGTCFTEAGSGRFDWKNYSKYADNLNVIFECYDIPINKFVIFIQPKSAVLFLPCLLNLGARWVHILEKRDNALSNWFFLNGFSRFSFGDNKQDFDWLFQPASSSTYHVLVIDDEIQFVGNSIVDLFDCILVHSSNSIVDEDLHDKLLALGFCLKSFNHIKKNSYVHVLVKTQNERV